MFYLVLGHCIPKIRSNIDVYNKKNGPTMTKGIESSHLSMKTILFFR